MQFFFGHLVNRYPHSSVSTLNKDKVTTAREFNVHVRPARTKYKKFFCGTMACIFRLGSWLRYISFKAEKTRIPLRGNR